MLIFRIFIGCRPQVPDNLKAQFLRLSTLAVVFARERLEALSQAAETDGIGRMLEDIFDAVIVGQFIAVHPYALSHEERVVVDVFLLDNMQAFKQIIMTDFDVFIKQLPELIHIAF